MNDPMFKYYDPNNIEHWINKQPYDVLTANVSNARKYIELLGNTGFGTKDTASLSYDYDEEEVIFDTQPPLSFGQLSAKLAKHVLVIHHLIMIGHRYWQPPESRQWDEVEDFKFQINITDNFDSPSFAIKNRMLPPLSMLLAISKGLVIHGKEMEFCFELLAKPEIMDQVHFDIYNRNYPISIFNKGLVDHSRLFTLIGQTGIAYVNAKRNKHD